MLQICIGIENSFVADMVRSGSLEAMAPELGIHELGFTPPARLVRARSDSMGDPQPLLYVTYSYTPTTQDVDKAHAMSDLNMLPMVRGGLERSEKQYCPLDQNGFRQTSIRSAGRFSVIEAHRH